MCVLGRKNTLLWKGLLFFLKIRLRGLAVETMETIHPHIVSSARFKGVLGMAVCWGWLFFPPKPVVSKNEGVEFTM